MTSEMKALSHFFLSLLLFFLTNLLVLKGLNSIPFKSVFSLSLHSLRISMFSFILPSFSLSASFFLSLSLLSPCSKPHLMKTDLSLSLYQLSWGRKMNPNGFFPLFFFWWWKICTDLLMCLMHFITTDFVRVKAKPAQINPQQNHTMSDQITNQSYLQFLTNLSLHENTIFFF